MRKRGKNIKGANDMTKKMILYFLAGFIVAAVVIPLLRGLGVPGFENLLIAMFGKDNIYGVIFGFAVVGVLVAITYVVMKKFSRAEES